MENFYEEKLISCVDLDKRKKKKKKKRQMRESIYLSTIKRDRERERGGGNVDATEETIRFVIIIRFS